MSDHHAPECQAAREGLSGLLDGEDPGVSAPWLTEHLVGCADCRDWYAAAQDLRRRTRMTVIPDVPPSPAAILAAVSHDDPPPGLWSRLGAVVPRTVVVLCAALLLWRSLPLLILGHDPDTGVHPAHELGSYQVALALALLLAVVRPSLARTIAGVVGSVGGLLVITAVVDLIHGGRTTVSDEAPHLLWLVACGALLAMPRPRLAGAAEQTVPDTVTPLRRRAVRAPGRPPTGTTRHPTSSTHRSA
jgi:predicted anti-sigma-YlaC factor YlaD